MIKAVIFDCFGVLTTDTWNAFVNSLPDTANVELARELNRQYDKGMITTQEFLDQVKKATGAEPKMVEVMLDNEVAKNTPLLDYIKELKREYKIGLLSNVATGWIRDHFLTPEEGKLFDTMVFSYEVGMAKPDPRLFELACNRLGIEPDEAIMVDDIERYCDAAREVGMQAVCYEDFDQFKHGLEQLLSQT